MNREEKLKELRAQALQLNKELWRRMHYLVLRMEPHAKDKIYTEGSARHVELLAQIKELEEGGAR